MTQNVLCNVLAQLLKIVNNMKILCDNNLIVFSFFSTWYESTQNDCRRFERHSRVL